MLRRACRQAGHFHDRAELEGFPVGEHDGLSRIFGWTGAGELEGPLIDALALQWAALGGLSGEGILSLDVEKVRWGFAARRTQVMEMLKHSDGGR